jgi:glutamate synthase (NADPH/NADH) small chain
VGNSFPTARLQSEFDATVLCGGATWARDLTVEGRSCKGVHFAMEFLTASAKSFLDSNFADGNYISAKDQKVVVIGGGDTGTDCVGTSLRHGCASLVQLEILSRPPDDRAADNPWPQWPKVYKLDYGQEEAAALYGHDPRLYSISTKRILGDDNGRVRALQVVTIRRAPGNPSKWEEVPGSEREIPATLVLLAMGFLGPERPGLLTDLGVKLDARGNVAVGEDKQSSVPGVFAAGDMSRGQSLIVWAIAEGRQAARGVDRYLMGRTVLV